MGISKDKRIVYGAIYGNYWPSNSQVKFEKSSRKLPFCLIHEYI